MSNSGVPHNYQVRVIQVSQGAKHVLKNENQSIVLICSFLKNLGRIRG